jgi:hypothetical protein
VIVSGWHPGICRLLVDRPTRCITQDFGEVPTADFAEVITVRAARSRAKPLEPNRQSGVLRCGRARGLLRGEKGAARTRGE